MAGIIKRLLQRARMIGPVDLNGAGGLSSLLPTGADSNSGVQVTVESALHGTAVLACVRVLSETIATLPLHVYRRANGRRSIATDHPADMILHRRPNPEITSFEMREWLMNNCLTYGNGYAIVERDRIGQPLAVWPQIASRVVAFRAPGTHELWYRVHNAGEAFVVPAGDMLHVRGFANGGLIGRSPIDLGRNALGLADAQEQYAGRVFATGGAQRMALEHPGGDLGLSPTASDNLRKSWRDIYGAPERVHEVAILEEGLTAKVIGVSPTDTQLIEGRVYQVAEVARMFRVPLHMIGELTRSTNNNIEHQSLEFVKYAILPWSERFEQRLDMTLLSGADSDLYCKFALEGLLRGDSKARAEFYRALFAVGALSANDIRALEDLDSIGDQGDHYMVPLNMIPASKIDTIYVESDIVQEPAAPAQIEEPAPERSAVTVGALVARYMPLLRDVLGRVVRAEVRERRKDLSADVSEFVARCLAPVVTVLMGDLADLHGWDSPVNPMAIADGLALEYVQRSQARIDGGSDPDSVLSEWVESRIEIEAEIVALGIVAASGGNGPCDA